MRELTLAEVETLLREAIAYSQSIGRPSSAAVVDMGGNLRGALRPERGRISNILFAEKKAWTAVAFQRPTEMVREILCLVVWPMVFSIRMSVSAWWEVGIPSLTSRAT